MEASEVNQSDDGFGTVSNGTNTEGFEIVPLVDTEGFDMDQPMEPVVDPDEV